MTSSAFSGTTSHSLKQRLRNARHALYDLLPFVKRKYYRRCIIERDAARAEIAEQRINLQKELSPICMTLLSLPESLASNARIEWMKPIAHAQGTTELCLFVTHVETHELKLHIVDHIRQLVSQGIAVVLVINTDLDHTLIRIQDDVLAILHACIVRENIGYDFGAWSHAYSLLDASNICRLYLVNDSIVGPLNNQAFSAMVRRIRECDGDLIGLTQNPYPKWHLQSFFLAFNKKLLSARTFNDLIHYVVNLPTKEAVINTYEIQMSSFLTERGFQCRSVFAHLEPDSTAPDDTHARWHQLIENGFPFIKASILKEFRNHPKAIELVPQRYRETP